MKYVLAVMILFFAVNTKAQNKATPENSRTFTVNGIKFTMKRVKAGTFVMKKRRKSRKITLTKDYWIGETEVVQALYTYAKGENPSTGSKYCASCPVESVSWDSVQVFIKKLNEQAPGLTFRLPTEAEWEFAAGGGNLSKGYKFAGTSSEEELHKYANFCDINCSYAKNYETRDDGYAKTSPIKTYLPNELGLYDMCGNVGEWTQDTYETLAETSQTDPVYFKEGEDRVICGCHWALPTRLHSIRNHIFQNYRAAFLGFRLSATSLPAQKEINALNIDFPELEEEEISIDFEGN